MFSFILHYICPIVLIVITIALAIMAYKSGKKSKSMWISIVVCWIFAVSVLFFWSDSDDKNLIICTIIAYIGAWNAYYCCAKR